LSLVGVLALVIIKPIVQMFVRRRGDETVIVGSDLMTGEVFDELTEEYAPKRRIVHYDEIGSLPQENTFSRIVLVDRKIPEGSDAAQALVSFKLRGVKIETALECFERTRRRIWIDGLSSEWLIFAHGFRPSKFYSTFKRIADIALSCVLLILTSPLMLLIAVLIKLDSSGSVIFKQERIGYLGSTFVLYKFRSMCQDAEIRTGPIWARQNDERYTAVGGFLRRWRFDELPQMVNVLRGEMSFVGPRPERPYFVNLLRSNLPYYDIRHYVKPGISGWAQVMYPYGASIEDAHKKLQYDLYYSKNISFGLDVLILLRTIKVMFGGKGR
jgi:exopolysaccharide biosynthesis polyprenyl glycosylphosphotransferase